MGLLGFQPNLPVVSLLLAFNYICRTRAGGCPVQSSALLVSPISENNKFSIKSNIWLFSFWWRLPIRPLKLRFRPGACLRRRGQLNLIPIQKNNLTSLSRLAVRVYCLRLAALLAYFFELVLQRFSGRLKAFRRHLEYLLFSDSLENQAAVLWCSHKIVTLWSQRNRHDTT